MLNQFGDCVAAYIVEMGRMNDTMPRIIREVVDKCDYMAAARAERLTPGYIALHVYQKKNGGIK